MKKLHMTQISIREKQKEILWRQKSRVLWLREGERNSKFFHNSMIQRRHQNKITSLRDNQGNKVNNHQDIQSELMQYYSSLMQEPQQHRNEAIKKITQHIPKILNEDHNEALMRQITMEEVEQAIWEIPKGKSPGPDGFTVDFYQACWPVIKNESLGSGGRLPQISKSSPFSQCHLSHSHSQRRKSGKSQ
jgi:hypothetical protein